MTADLKHVLCIDDEEDILEVAGMSLEAVGGLQVSRANNGAEGIACAKSVHPDMILLDVMLPGMDGPETLKKIKQDDALKGIPVVFMTARVQPEEVKKYLSYGAIAVIEKPFDPMTLAGKVQQAWKESHGPE